MGESGSGKSASLRNFAPNEISVFNVTNKPLPFKQGKTKIPKIDNATYTDIANALANPDKRAYVIDDAGCRLSFEMGWVVKMDNMLFELDNTVFELDKEKYNELRRLCEQLGRFIEDNFPQCTSVVVDADKFVVKEDVIASYFELKL